MAEVQMISLCDWNFDLGEQVRGTLGSLNQLVICVGILAALLVNVAIDQSQWRNMFFLAIVPAMLLVLGALFPLHTMSCSTPTESS